MGKYDQIFYISGSKGEFADCYMERGYLPALESAVDGEPVETGLWVFPGDGGPPHLLMPVDTEGVLQGKSSSRGLGYSQLLKEIAQLKGALNFLERKVNKLEGRLSKRDKGSW